MHFNQNGLTKFSAHIPHHVPSKSVLYCGHHYLWTDGWTCQN